MVAKSPVFPSTRLVPSRQAEFLLGHPSHVPMLHMAEKGGTPLRRRSSRPFDPSDICGAIDDPPPLTLDPVLIDRSDYETTPDQQRIEEALEGLPLHPATAILHVGVGNSGLARRFAPRVGAIDGLTVSRREKQLGDSLGIGGYNIHLLNKHAGKLVRDLGRRYDFIIDNNLASFACCSYHFYRTFDEYSHLLGPDGRVLTDRTGMAWRVDDDPAWILTYEDLVQLGGRFGLQAGRITDSVYELRRS